MQTRIKGKVKPAFPVGTRVLLTEDFVGHGGLYHAGERGQIHKSENHDAPVVVFERTPGVTNPIPECLKSFQKQSTGGCKMQKLKKGDRVMLVAQFKTKAFDFVFGSRGIILRIDEGGHCPVVKMDSQPNQEFFIPFCDLEKVSKAKKELQPA